MSLTQGTDRKSSIDRLRFKRRTTEETVSANPSRNSPPSTSSIPQPPPYGTLPAQSRDASLPSRFFAYTPSTPISTGRVLVPNSSPLAPDDNHHYNQSPYHSHIAGVAPGLVPPDPWSYSHRPFPHDPLSAPSGFVSNGVPLQHASVSRPIVPNGHRTTPIQIPVRGEPPRKRVNRGPSASPPDPLDLFRIPDSPEIVRPVQRRVARNVHMIPPTSDDESIPEVGPSGAGPSKPRLVRHSAARPEPITSEPDADDERFTKFKITQPFHSLLLIRAAWTQAGGDERKASALLDDPGFTTSTASPMSNSSPSNETGRVKEIDDALKADRARFRELGKKSTIYQALPTLDTKVVSTPPASKSAIEASTKSPLTPGSPQLVLKKPRRLKRKVLETESEPEDTEEEEEVVRSSSNEDETVEYFNTATGEALQELSGCTAEQASKITGLRPFTSIDDLNTKLAQGRKKAGPSGISPRMVEDCAQILQGYATVDDVLAKCEGIGAKLKKEIASWTVTPSTSTKDPGSHKGSAAPSRGSSVASDLVEDGALSLRSQAVLVDNRPAYFISAQPPTLSESLQLKEYQMLGINWLNLLYRRGYSCILADEMGLGKTVQVISFFAHLQEKGCNGPHLVVVPSSTLENWVREFRRFAPGIVVQTYYAGKDDRPALRQRLRETQRTQRDDGWEVLLATYNLAQGDEHDRKFFRSVSWEACVFDEGHVLKNFQSQRYQALLKYGARWRLLLTGTPLQNNLQELVSLMNFILPDLIGPRLNDLRAVFKAKGDSKITLLAQERVSRAKKMLTPFVLRRRKDQVLQDLPKKRERIEWCEMTPLQKSIYNDALRRSRKTIFDLEEQQVAAATTTTPNDNANGTNARSGKPPPKKKARTNGRTKDKMYLENSANVLMDLRKAALHPMLFRRRFTDETLTSITKVLLKEQEFKQRGAIFQYVKEDMEVMTDAELQAFCNTYKSTRRYLQQEDCYTQAGKIKVLLQLLQGYQKENRRVLIFSQFTQVLDILQRILDLYKIKFLILTGSTAVDVRQALVDEFTDDESIPVFLLSTKAGGMGINLTAASVVIMFDQDFNPHNDKQAQDRAYRIGQKRDVEVIKLITKGSIEEDILQLGMTKLALDEAVAGEEGAERIEQEMKTTLMNVVRQKLEEVKEDDNDNENESESEKLAATKPDTNGKGKGAGRVDDGNDSSLTEISSEGGDDKMDTDSKDN